MDLHWRCHSGAPGVVSLLNAKRDSDLKLKFEPGLSCSLSGIGASSRVWELTSFLAHPDTSWVGNLDKERLRDSIRKPNSRCLTGVQEKTRLWLSRAKKEWQCYLVNLSLCGIEYYVAILEQNEPAGEKGPMAGLRN